jgi:Flp pilus assembly protein TadG
MRRQAGSALLEFAIAWPVTLLLVMGAVQLAVWGSEAYSVRQAALAGARAASGVGGTAAVAQSTALAVLRPSLVGVSPTAWCPGLPGHPRVWVCVRYLSSTSEVRVGGSVPALVPIFPGSGGLPVGADVILPREAFQ